MASPSITDRWEEVKRRSLERAKSTIERINKKKQEDAQRQKETQESAKVSTKETQEEEIDTSVAKLFGPSPGTQSLDERFPSAFGDLAPSGQRQARLKSNVGLAGIGMPLAREHSSFTPGSPYLGKSDVSSELRQAARNRKLNYFIGAKR